ncbi:hypothetical protein GMD78_20535 [Ornithinibacillus sp. L9]|uniref:Inner spore coat protein n=1 Tax=Ornithinibacillus caprae TaxID=2678566 RepID=A0A6N8FQS8_9BACI|nr:hypothetical protein [Ornithinibacillus caprae]MUK90747.1 hypothetical protein [Ornithinibacillus caprae]
MYYVCYPYPDRNPVYFQPAWGYPVQSYQPSFRQQYPDVDPDLFFQSAGVFKKLMADASIILNKLSEDEDLAYEIMDAAQKNQATRVKELIKSTGVHGDVDVDFNPDGLNLEMHSKVEDTECCKLSMALRWR